MPRRSRRHQLLGVDRAASRRRCSRASASRPPAAIAPSPRRCALVRRDRSLDHTRSRRSCDLSPDPSSTRSPAMRDALAPTARSRSSRRSARCTTGTSPMSTVHASSPTSWSSRSSSTRPSSARTRISTTTPGRSTADLDLLAGRRRLRLRALRRGDVPVRPDGDHAWLPARSARCSRASRALVTSMACSPSWPSC